MDTVNVNIVYRPIRVAFAIRSNDMENFRRAARFSCALWGGRFNPIILIDRPEARNQVELFRPDMVMPLGDHPDVVAFAKEFPQWVSPLFSKDLFTGDANYGGRCQLLDIQNLLHHRRDHPDWKGVLTSGVRIAKWHADDPMADVMLCQFGAYPDPQSIHVDYEDILTKAANATVLNIDIAQPLPAEMLDQFSVQQFTRYALSPHYTSPSGFGGPGIYVGDGSNVIDLANFWNIRASGPSIVFFDTQHAERCRPLCDAYAARLRADFAAFDEHRRHIAIWSRSEIQDGITGAFGEGVIYSAVDEVTWNGLNIRAAVVHFGEETALGMLVEGKGPPRVSFALRQTTFSQDSWFHDQHLVASISFRLYRRDPDKYIFIPPFVPELNEFAGRRIWHNFRGVRIEPERVGLIIDATTHNIDFNGIPVSELIEKIFEIAGIKAKLSGGGLITEQLLARMGGPDGARSFKIPGVRRLLKTYGPTKSFTGDSAIQLIASRNLDRGTTFQQHEQLYIESRPNGSKLTPSMVFSHLVEKGLFRMGVDLKCPTCSLTSWTSLDDLRQKTTCSLCSASFDATRQLISGKYAYRRSGVLGLEKNAQGAVPVALLMQQLKVNISGLSGDAILSSSYDLEAIPPCAIAKCETDFVVILREPRSSKPCILIGECKDQGGSVDKNDIDRLRDVADAFPKHRFRVCILLAKLSPFTAQEIALAQSLNTQYDRRVILLSDRELEPYHIYERVNEELGVKLSGHNADSLVDATQQIYFSPVAPSAAQEPATPDNSAGRRTEA